jgi:hypothetical protein
LFFCINRFSLQDLWLKKRTRVTQEPSLRIPMTHWTGAAGAGWRTAANFLHPIIFLRDETCIIDVAVTTAGTCKIKRSEKSSNAAKCSEKNILRANCYGSHGLFPEPTAESQTNANGFTKKTVGVKTPRPFKLISYSESVHLQEDGF